MGGMSNGIAHKKFVRCDNRIRRRNSVPRRTPCNRVLRSGGNSALWLLRFVYRSVQTQRQKPRSKSFHKGRPNFRRSLCKNKIRTSRLRRFVELEEHGKIRLGTFYGYDRGFNRRTRCRRQAVTQTHFSKLRGLYKWLLLIQ